MKRAIAFSILLIMLSSVLLYPVAAQEQVAGAQQEQQEMTEVQQADADARRDAEQDVSTISWGIGGFFCGVCAIAYVYINEPQVPAAQLVGKSASYVTLYTDAYNREVKKQRFQATMIGCLASSVFSTLTIYLAAP